MLDMPSMSTACLCPVPQLSVRMEGVRQKKTKKQKQTVALTAASQGGWTTTKGLGNHPSYETGHVVASLEGCRA